MVVFKLACPSHWLIVAKSTPAFSRCMAVVMAKAVRVRQLVSAGGHCAGTRGVLVQQVAHTESRQLLASLVAKDRLVDVPVVDGSDASDELAEQLRGTRPDRTEPRLIALAAEANLMRCIETNIATTKVEYFLDTCPCVEEQREEHEVAAPLCASPVDAFEERLHPSRLQIVGGYSGCAAF